MEKKRRFILHSLFTPQQTLRTWKKWFPFQKKKNFLPVSVLSLSPVIHTDQCNTHTESGGSKERH